VKKVLDKVRNSEELQYLESEMAMERERVRDELRRNDGELRFGLAPVV
jgi:hypothetical protein